MPKYKVTIERWDDEGEVDTLLNVPVTAEQVADIAGDLLATALGVEFSDEPRSETTTAAVGSETPRQRRKRRTKAEIAADEAKAEIAADEAKAAEPANPVPAEAAPTEGPAEVVVPTNQTPALDTPSVSVTTTFEGAAPLATGGIVGGPGAPAGASYNPFIK